MNRTSFWKRIGVWKRIGITILAVFVLFCGYAYYKYWKFQKKLELLARGLSELEKNLESDTSQVSNAADSLSNSTTSTALIEGDSISLRD